jgi:hypothetical protein
MSHALGVLQAAPAPEQGTALFGLVLLAAASGGLWIWRRLRGQRGFGAHEVLLTLVIATLMSSAAFWWTDVLPRLGGERLIDFSREPDPLGAERAFISFLEEVDRTLPDGEGVVLVNCRTGVVTDQANYILYPRLVVLRPLSMLLLGDPRELLSDERQLQLRSTGAQWILDLEPRVWRRGAADALIPLDGLR